MGFRKNVPKRVTVARTAAAADGRNEDRVAEAPHFAVHRCVALSEPLRFAPRQSVRLKTLVPRVSFLKMSDQLVTRLFNELEALRLIDPHSHINPHAAASANLGDILGYHYYTELAHSAGMPKDADRRAGTVSRRRKRSETSSTWLAKLDNTVQVSWLDRDPPRVLRLRRRPPHDRSNWETVYDTTLAKMAGAGGWEEQVLDQSGLDGVFLTNDFDDPLEGFDTSKLHPLPANRRPRLQTARTVCARTAREGDRHRSR